MKEFDFYGTVGVIAPGMVLIVGAIVLFFPDHSKDVQAIAGISLGSLGVGLILAYVGGQLLQSIGNGVEMAWWWCWGGMPTDWVRTGKRELIAPTQRTLVESRVQGIFGNSSFSFSEVNKDQWYSITRQVYAATAAANRSARIDLFNGNYGLCRGITAALVVLLIGSFIAHWRAWQVEVGLIALIILAVCRMHRFGVRYGRELFVQFIQSPCPADIASAKAGGQQ